MTVWEGSTWVNPYPRGKKEIGIFELSELFGITSETLRKYESKRLLQPKRNQSGYRTYNSWDLTKIIRTRQLRQEGFSLNAVAEQVSTEGFDGVRAIEDMQGKLLEQIEREKRLIRWLDIQKEKQKRLDSIAQNVVVERLPELLCCVFMVDDTLVEKRGNERRQFKAWIDALPFAHICYIGNQKERMLSCLTLSAQERKELALTQLVPDFVLPERLCLACAATAEHREEYDSSDACLAQARERVSAAGLPLADYAVVQMVRFSQANDVFHSYNIAYFPIQNLTI